MSDSEFFMFRERSKNELARQRSEDNGSPIKQALIQAEAEVLRYLPEGRNTKNNYFYLLKNELAEDCGYIWFGEKLHLGKKHIFLFDILVEVNFRGRGFSKIMLAFLETETKKLEYDEIALHVLDYNYVAIKLYKSLGYEGETQRMFKKLV